MDDQDHAQAGRVPLAGQGELRTRERGIRQSRRAANWTAAALLAGVAVGAGYFAHHPAVPAAGKVTYTQPGGAVHGGGQHVAVTQPVATSGGSGVTAGPGSPSGSAGSGGLGWRDN